MLPKPPAEDASKRAWRLWAKATRAKIDPEVTNRLLVASLCDQPIFTQAEHILTYLAFGTELDVQGLEGCPTKTFYATRTTGEGLEVHLLEKRVGLEPHPLGYQQPAATSPTLEPHKIDLALIPGLAFDKSGARLGYGKGYYDKLLPQLRPDVPRVGVTADALVLQTLPQDAHDIPMTHLLSESGLYKVYSG